VIIYFVFRKREKSFFELGTLNVFVPIQTAARLAQDIMTAKHRGLSSRSNNWHIIEGNVPITSRSSKMVVEGAVFVWPTTWVMCCDCCWEISELPASSYAWTRVRQPFSRRRFRTGDDDNLLMKEFRGNSSRHTGSWTSENEHTFARVLSVDFSRFGCCFPGAYKQMSWITLFSSCLGHILASPQYICSQLPLQYMENHQGKHSWLW